MPIYVERTILDLPRLYINGGARGFLVGIAPADLVRVLKPTPVYVGSTGPGARGEGLGLGPVLGVGSI